MTIKNPKTGHACIVCDTTGQLYWTGKSYTYELREAKLYKSEMTAQQAVNRNPSMKQTIKHVKITIIET